MNNKEHLSPLRAIREYCMECMNGQIMEIRLCPTKACPFYNYRFGIKEGEDSALKIIVKKCEECGEGNKKSINECRFEECPVFSYRKGHNPMRKNIGKGGNTRKDT